MLTVYLFGPSRYVMSLRLLMEVLERGVLSQVTEDSVVVIYVSNYSLRVVLIIVG